MTDIPRCPNCLSSRRHVRNQLAWREGQTIPCGHDWHNVDQLELDMQPYVKPEYVEGETIQQRFSSFASKNPWVLTALEKLTVDYLERGHKKIGIGMLTEVLRWSYGRATVGDEFRLNNNYRSRYVRLMIERHPEWADVFDTRELKAA